MPHPMLPLRIPKSRRADALSLRLWGLACLAALGMALVGAPAAAVLISTGDGSGNTSPPPDDPGLGNVGVILGRSGVYVRNGWVLTANHVGVNPIRLGSLDYLPVPGSRVRFQNSDGTSADLIAYKLIERPPLPGLAIASAPPSTGSLLTLVGNGYDRGAETSWMGYSGWAWASSRSLRWGTNRISDSDAFTLETQTFWTLFDEVARPSAGAHEADVVPGDSGGGAFSGSGTGAELIGILIGRASFQDQPASTSLHGSQGFGNAGVIADLFAYRDDILDVIDRPDCDDGIDEDLDGLVDYPDDPGCASASDWSERDTSLVCDNGLDDDGDGLRDFPSDPGCSFPTDPDERGAIYECDNGVDDDGDQLVDFPEDDGCLHPTNPVEAPEPAFTALIASGVVGMAAAIRRRASTRGT